MRRKKPIPPIEKLSIDGIAKKGKGVGRTDEGQLGLSYKEIEEAMDNENSKNRDKYIQIRKANLHKMEPIPICKIPN